MEVEIYMEEYVPKNHFMIQTYNKHAEVTIRCSKKTKWNIQSFDATHIQAKQCSNQSKAGYKENSLKCLRKC